MNAAQAMVDVVYALRTLQAPHHEALGDGILVLTDVMSEPYPANSVVPNHCVATFDRRTLPGETADGVLAPIARCVEVAVAESGAHGSVCIAEDDFTTYTGARVTGRNFADAWYVPEGDAIVQRALRAMREAGIEPRTTHYAFCTNGSGTAGMGIRTVGFGPGTSASPTGRMNTWILATSRPRRTATPPSSRTSWRCWAERRWVS